MKRLVLAFLVVWLLLLGACAPTRVSEPAIPVHFNTYTDELGLFSISYPPDWELALWAIEDLEQFTKELLKSIDQDASLEKHGVIFAAGVPMETGYYSPNVNMIVTPLTAGGLTLDEEAEAATQYVKDIAKEYHEFSRVKTTVDGKEAVIVEYEADFLGLDRSHHLVMMMFAGRVGWTVTCTTTPDRFGEFEADLHAIVRSLRILK